MHGAKQKLYIAFLLFMPKTNSGRFIHTTFALLFSAINHNMNNSSLTKGVILVSIGAASYGILATLVGLAYKEGYSTT